MTVSWLPGGAKGLEVGDQVVVVEVMGSGVMIGWLDVVEDR